MGIFKDAGANTGKPKMEKQEKQEKKEKPQKPQKPVKEVKEKKPKSGGGLFGAKKNNPSNEPEPDTDMKLDMDQEVASPRVPRQLSHTGSEMNGLDELDSLKTSMQGESEFVPIKSSNVAFNMEETGVPRLPSTSQVSQQQATPPLVQSVPLPFNPKQAGVNSNPFNSASQVPSTKMTGLPSTQGLPSLTSNPTQGLPTMRNNPTQGMPSLMNSPTQGLPPMRSNPTQGLPPLTNSPTQGLPPLTNNLTQGLPPLTNNLTQGLPSLTNNPTQGLPPIPRNNGAVPASQGLPPLYSKSDLDLSGLPVTKEASIQEKADSTVSNLLKGVNGASPESPKGVFDGGGINLEMPKALDHIPTPRPVSPLNPKGLSNPQNITPLGRPIATKPEVPIANVIRQDTNKILDVDAVKTILAKEGLVKALLSDNTAYRDATISLDTLEKEIQSIFVRKDIPASEKFSLIKQKAFEKSDTQSLRNNELVNKYLTLVSYIVDEAEKVANTRVEEVSNELKCSKFGENLISNTTEIAQRIERRVALRNELHNILISIRNIYDIISSEGSSIINGLSEGLPTEIEYINKMFYNSEKVFTPQGASTLATLILEDLKRDADRFLILSNKLEDLIKVIFQFSVLDSEAAEDTNRIIEILKTNRVEQLVVPRNLLQTRLRVFIGPSGIGRTATMVTVAGRNSRRGNTLSLNLSTEISLSRYGIQPKPFSILETDKVRKENLFVEEGLPDMSGARVMQIVNTLEEHLAYYQYVNVFLDETQAWVLEALKEYILSVTFITSSTVSSMNCVQELYNGFKSDNSAVQLAVIDAVDDLADILTDMGIDILSTKVISIPHITRMRSYALRKKPPYEDKDIGTLFDELFK